MAVAASSSNRRPREDAAWQKSRTASLWPMALMSSLPSPGGSWTGPAPGANASPVPRITGGGTSRLGSGKRCSPEVPSETRLVTSICTARAVDLQALTVRSAWMAMCSKLSRTRRVGRASDLRKLPITSIGRSCWSSLNPKASPMATQRSSIVSLSFSSTRKAPPGK